MWETDTDPEWDAACKKCVKEVKVKEKKIWDKYHATSLYLPSCKGFASGGLDNTVNYCSGLVGQVSGYIIALGFLISFVYAVVSAFFLDRIAQNMRNLMFSFLLCFIGLTTVDKLMYCVDEVAENISVVFERKKIEIVRDEKAKAKQRMEEESIFVKKGSFLWRFKTLGRYIMNIPSSILTIFSADMMIPFFIWLRHFMITICFIFAKLAIAISAFPLFKGVFRAWLSWFLTQSFCLVTYSILGLLIESYCAISWGRNTCFAWMQQLGFLLILLKGTQITSRYISTSVDSGMGAGIASSAMTAASMAKGGVGKFAGIVGGSLAKR